MMIKKYKHDFDYSYALGMTLTMELLRSRPQVCTHVYLSPSIDKNENYERLLHICSQHGIETEESEKIFRILSPKGNCFVIGVFRKFEAPLADGTHVVLVNPSDAGNLGTILRTSAGFGTVNVAIIRPAIDIFDPKTVRASMGALFHINFKMYDSFAAYQAEFPDRPLYPFMLTASTPITDVRFEKPCSLIFGNEASGLPDSFAYLEHSTPVVIRHSDRIDSLNLPTAVGIGIFCATRGDF